MPKYISDQGEDTYSLPAAVNQSLLNKVKFNYPFHYGDDYSASPVEDMVTLSSALSRMHSPLHQARDKPTETHTRTPVEPASASPDCNPQLSPVAPPFS